MATVTLVDYSDIYNAIIEELKIQSSDGTTIARIKRDINTIYLGEVMPYHQWWWARKNCKISTEVKITSGTISVTNGSSTATLSSTYATSLVGYHLNITGTEEIYDIQAHTAGTAALTLGSVDQGTALNYVGTTNATAGYTIWKD